MLQLRVATIGVAILVLAGCSGPAPDGPSSTGRTVQATLRDDMSIELSETEFTVGETVIFEVTNAGSAQHELYLGDEAAQAVHADEMASGSGMRHDEPGGVRVEPGTTDRFGYTFARAGEILAGCHEPGHYEAGMVTSVTVAAGG